MIGARIVDFVRSLWRELAKFGVIGVINIVIDLGLYNLLIDGPMPTKVTAAKIVSGTVATLFAWVGNRYWTYKERESGGSREMVLFLAINGIAIAIQTGITALTYYVMNLDSHFEIFFSKFILGIGIGMAFRFWCYRTFIFPEAEPALAGDQFPYSEPLPTSQLETEAPRSGSGALLSKTSR